ncbi:MAG: hypothetical protein U0931_04075 [Vulcanimicrobiota bacterium]
MNKLQVSSLALVLAGALSADPLEPSPRLESLARALPAVGKNVKVDSLGIQLVPSSQPAPKAAQDASSYKIYYPTDLDRRSTDDAAYAGKYPGVHLNLPLKTQPSYINYLFLSDQPERVLDDRKRTPAAAAGSPAPGPGATGIYARSPIPGGSTVRVLVDHTNGTKRNLRFDLVWIPRKAGFLTVRKRSLSVHQDSVAAGKQAFVDQAAQVVVEPRIELAPDKSVVLISQLLKPEDTVVLHEEYFSSAPGDLAAVISEVESPQVAGKGDLDGLPVMHSIVWKEEEEKLGKFIDKNADPTRWNRIKQSFQHARGHFPSPDRLSEVDYQVSSWSENDYPMQVYSKFESIPGVDVTVNQGTATDNRGKYGARVGMRWNLKALPPGCKEVAVVALNRGAVFGGRHWVSDGRKTVSEVFHSPNNPGLLPKLYACTLWRGPVQVGDQIQMWTEPMANTSVQLWYLLVPIPPK